MRINEMIRQWTSRPLSLKGQDYWLQRKMDGRVRGREGNLDQMGGSLEMEPGNDISLLKIG